jgi:putative membrane protein
MTTVQKKRWGVHLVASLGGLGLLGLLIWKVGVTEVVGHLYQIGWLAPFALLPYAAAALCDTKGWDYTIPQTLHGRPVSLLHLSLSRLAGEAINNLTPTANVGGEAVKVYLLRAYGITTEVGMASVVAAKTALTVSQVIFILLGLPFFLAYLGWGQHIWWVLGLFLIMAYGFVMLLIHWQRRGLAGMAIRMLRRWLPRWQKLEHWEVHARQIDVNLLHFYDKNPRAFITSTVYHLLGWLVGAVEVWIFFLLIGVSVDFFDALIIETMLQPVTAAALVIPGGLGVREVGGVFLCRLLGIDEGAGLTLMVLKRVREAIYNSIGLVVLARAGGAFFLQRAQSV